MKQQIREKYCVIVYKCMSNRNRFWSSGRRLWTRLVSIASNIHAISYLLQINGGDIYRNIWVRWKSRVIGGRWNGFRVEQAMTTDCVCCCCCCWPQMMFIWKLSCYRVYVGMRCQSDATHSTHRYWQLHFNQLAPQRSMDHFTAGFSKLLGIHSTRLWLWNVRPVPEWHRQ